MYKSAIIIALGLLLTASAAAWAEDFDLDSNNEPYSGRTINYTDVSLSQRFDDVDASGNGMISWREAEAVGMLRQVFEALNGTPDTAITMDEYVRSLD